MLVWDGMWSIKQIVFRTRVDRFDCVGVWKYWELCGGV